MAISLTISFTRFIRPSSYESSFCFSLSTEISIAIWSSLYPKDYSSTSSYFGPEWAPSSLLFRRLRGGCIFEDCRLFSYMMEELWTMELENLLM